MMAIVNDKTLRVQAQVDRAVLQKLLGNHSAVETSENEGWFFADYSPADFPLKTVFNLSFSSAGRILSSSTDISIKAVFDSFGHMLQEGIPKGFKTVVNLEFPDGLPEVFKKLSVTTRWEPTGEEVLLTSTETIQFNNFPELLTDLAQFMVTDLQDNYYPDAKKIEREEFINSLKKSGLKNSEDLLTFLTLGGFVRQTGNEVELIAHK